MLLPNGGYLLQVLPRAFTVLRWFAAVELLQQQPLLLQCSSLLQQASSLLRLGLVGVWAPPLLLQQKAAAGGSSSGSSSDLLHPAAKLVLLADIDIVVAAARSLKIPLDELL